MFGICKNEADVIAHANKYVSATFGFVLPESGVCPKTTIKFDECPIILTGFEDNINGVALGYDNKKYSLLNIAYQVTGVDMNGKAILKKWEQENK